jgi:hypothetical protein
MRLTIEIIAAALLVFCISATSAAFAAGTKTGRSADGLSCAFSVAKNASPAARCAAIRRQCGGLAVEQGFCFRQLGPVFS